MNRPAKKYPLTVLRLFRHIACNETSNSIQSVASSNPKIWTQYDACIIPQVTHHC